MNSEPIVTQNHLKISAKAAVRKTYVELIAEYPETYYYVVLTTSGEATPPSFSAWSVEALEREVARHKGKVNKIDLKWSYGESPYFCYHEHNFAELRRLYSQRPRMSTSMSIVEWCNEYNIRLGAIESAMRELDEEGLFGIGELRHKILINVEVMPPDSSNTECAKRLNPLECLVEWLAENDQ